jgi:hypothetical protein
MGYIGADDVRVQALIAHSLPMSEKTNRLCPPRAAIALGCIPMVPKHFRIIKRLAEYGFFRAGGILIVSQAFFALGNMLGMHWREGVAIPGVDFAKMGSNISVALPASLNLNVRDALESLEMGLLSTEPQTVIIRRSYL